MVSAVMWFISGLLVGGVATAIVTRRRYEALLPLIDEADRGDELRDAATRAVTERIERRYERILERTAELGRITNDDVEDMFCIGDSTAGRYLRVLARNGKLVRHGGGRGTYYTVVETL